MNPAYGIYSATIKTPENMFTVNGDFTSTPCSLENLPPLASRPFSLLLAVTLLSK
jgi:hypothetical protein